jgi:CHAT domain
VRKIRLVIADPQLRKSLGRLLRWHVAGVIPNVVVEEGELLHHEEPQAVIVYEMNQVGSTTQLTAFLREARFRHTYMIVVVDDQPCNQRNRIASLRIRENEGNADEPRWTLHQESDNRADDCVGAVLVKFSVNDKDNLATAIVPLVTSILRRLFVIVAPDKPILDETEECWLEAFRLSTLSSPPTTLIEQLMASIPMITQAWMKNTHRPLCIGIATQPEFPWEMIASMGAESEHGHGPVVVRMMHGPPEPAQSQSLNHKLRAVHIVCPVMGESFSSVDDLDPINGQRGLSAIRQFVAGSSGDVHMVSGAKTVENIAQSCKGGIEILHIACHARVNENAGGHGELWLAKDNFEYAWTPAKDFASALVDRAKKNRPPRVVVLEACFSGVGSESIAAELLAVGVSAVVFLQIRPSPEFAANVMAQFYSNLAKTYMLDHALRATKEVALVVAVSSKSDLDVLVPHAPASH